MTRDVITATTETSVSELVALMLTNDISGVPIVDDRRHVLGVVSEADLVARTGFGTPQHRLLSLFDEVVSSYHNLWRQKAEGLHAGEIMTVPALTAAPDEPVRDVAARLVTMAIKRLPVVDDDGRLVGIVSQRDLLRCFDHSPEEVLLAVEATLANPVRWPRGHGVRASLDGGVVSLTGWVHDSADTAAVELAVLGVPGVIGVRSDILVAGRSDHPATARAHERR
jgi:CBS-domain-containing membrane protein